jgi:hypothetical protein
MFEVQRSMKEGDVRVTTALNRMLGLSGAWVRDVAFGQEAVIVTVVLRAKKPACSGCGARGLKIKEHREKRWRALDLGGLRCVIECRLRRLYCPGCGTCTRRCHGPGRGSRYTRDFEDLTAWLAQQMSQTQVERLLRIAERGSLRRPRRDFSSWGAGGADLDGVRVPLPRGCSHELDAGRTPDGSPWRTKAATRSAPPMWPESV